MQTHATTENMSPSERFDLWAAEVSQMFGALDSRPATTASFHGSATSSRIGALQLSALSAGAMLVRRTAALAAHNEAHYKVVLQLAGTAHVEQDGEQCALTPGDLVICDTSRPYTFSYTSDFQTVMLMVPRPLLPLRPESLRSVVAQRIPTDDGIGAVAGPFLCSLGKAFEPSGPASSRLADSAVSLLAALLAERLDKSLPVSPHLAMTLRVQDYIEHHLPDPDLTPDSIARAHRVSRRYLFKIFAEEQATVSGWIRARRLERCARELADPGARDRPVTLIAARWGLLDARHFSRQFKAVYGLTPSEYRKQALNR